MKTETQSLIEACQEYVEKIVSDNNQEDKCVLANAFYQGWYFCKHYHMNKDNNE